MESNVAPSTCPKCRYPVAEGDGFCRNCGLAFDGREAGGAVAPPPVAASDEGVIRETAGRGAASRGPPAADAEDAGARTSGAPAQAGVDVASVRQVILDDSPSQPRDGEGLKIVMIDNRVQRELRTAPNEDPAVRESPPAPGVPEGGSDCADLDIQYNHSVVFVLGMKSTFDFRIRPRGEGIKDLAVEIREGDRLLVAQSIPVKLKPGAEIPFSLGCVPEHGYSGLCCFAIHIRYRADSAVRRYVAWKRHTIHDGREEPRKICESLKVEIRNNVTQGHAGDVRLSQHMDGLASLLQSGGEASVNQRMLSLICARPFWDVLHLHECEGDDVDGPPPPEAVRTRIGIVLDEVPVHLMDSTRVRAGRHRACEILARVHTDTGIEMADPSLRISAHHAYFEYSAGHFRVVDRGFYEKRGCWKPSAMGTAVDGRMVPSGQERVLEARHLICLAPPRADEAIPEEQRVEFEARVWSDDQLASLKSGCRREPAPGEPACLVLRRLHEPCEFHVLLRRGFPLAALDGRWTGLCVCREAGAYRLKAGGRCTWLVPGQTLSVGGSRIEVTAD